ncbi:hypothetical protein Ocin01_07485 [Orchesella cincta]|uniref:Uncharacterized protein n=1 Tax=Orchesella cincta TaxID=48709 RepID=A0A1D2N1M6_ORCCI|nr:hypothetical protein Ocin01_07485 [Orchesella cincta]
MGLTASERRARFVFLLDLILAGTPVTFYLIMLLILSVLWIFGEYNAAYSVLDWIFQSVMFVPKPMYGTPTNPGQVADLRMFFFSVWGIALLYNIVDIFMSLYLLKSMRMIRRPFLALDGSADIDYCDNNGFHHCSIGLLDSPVLSAHSTRRIL